MAGTSIRMGMLAILMGLTACARTQVRSEWVAPPAQPPGGPSLEAPPQPPAEALGRDTAPDSTQLVQVSAQGFQVQLRAPADAEVTQRGGVARIEAGGHFALEIRRGGMDVDSRKRAIEQTEGPRLQGFLVDTGDALLYESHATAQGLGGGFHVYAQRPVAGGLFICKSADDVAFSREEAEAMLAACRSLAVTGER